MPPSPVPPRTLHQTLAGHVGPTHVVRYAKGAGKYVMSGGQDRTVRLWKPQTGSQIQVYKGHGYEVYGLSVAHDNAKFASSGGDRSVFIWDVKTGQTIRRIPGHASKINTVEFNYDASVVASGSYDATVRLWDLRATSRQAIQVLEEARDAIQTIYVGPTQIISGSVDGHVRTYDLRMGELRADCLGPPVTSVLPTKDSQTILACTLDSTVRLMDMETGKLLNSFTSHKTESYRCRACFDAEERNVLCGDEEGRIWAWDLVDGKPLGPGTTGPPKVHEKVVLWIEHHVSDNELVSASADGTVKVWRGDSDR
ncbi:nuclear mRNA splicing protein [Sistotremastrum niveocremeum HHB9708]|uniref:Nuclear mRNA splicing protein n=2 Tax=Sistotremastraceae TaxID=3402574 RepID=A0A165A757_9AGAM|nr:nuclear mRNA splicing protein [Sistotremastrum niveocremeum HHB9708]KZT43499.1 nuclear mRNA splicing protein [Sistotremastrum suecicum HHB10207 ss-3]